MSLFLILGAFFGVEAGKVQGLQACGVQPNTTSSFQTGSWYHIILIGIYFITVKIIHLLIFFFSFVPLSL